MFKVAHLQFRDVILIFFSVLFIQICSKMSIGVITFRFFSKYIGLSYISELHVNDFANNFEKLKLSRTKK